MTPLERFEAKYVVEPNGCWRWTGYITAWGYGQFGASELAHRASWRLHKGEIPEGMCVLHKPECYHRWCVNPDHLYIGTRADNMADAIGAGTMVGRRLPTYGKKLNFDDVACIKKMLRDKIPEWLIAWVYQVARQRIWGIRTGRFWSRVTI